MEILEDKPISNYEVKKILEKENDEGLMFDQKVTKDFLNKNYNFDERIYEEVKKNLLERGYKDKVVVTILNVLPEYEEQVIAIFSKERETPSQEDIKFILDEVAKLIK